MLAIKICDGLLVQKKRKGAEIVRCESKMFPSIYCWWCIIVSCLQSITSIEAFVATSVHPVRIIYRNRFTELTYNINQKNLNILHHNSYISTISSIKQQDSPSSDNSLNSQFTTPINRPILAGLDLVTFIIFAAIGKASHTSTESLLVDLQTILITAAPFILSWFITSPLTQVYSRKDLNEDDNVILSSFLNTAKGWIVAVPIGCIFRGIVKGYAPPLPFVFITMIATLVLLGSVRLIFILIERRINYSS